MSRTVKREDDALRITQTVAGPDQPRTDTALSEYPRQQGKAGGETGDERKGTMECGPAGPVLDSEAVENWRKRFPSK